MTINYMGEANAVDAPIDNDDYNEWCDATINWLIQRNPGKLRIVAHAQHEEYGARTYFVIEVTGHTARVVVIPPFVSAYTLYFTQCWAREE